MITTTITYQGDTITVNHDSQNVAEVVARIFEAMVTDSRNVEVSIDEGDGITTKGSMAAFNRRATTIAQATKN